MSFKPEEILPPETDIVQEAKPKSVAFNIMLLLVIFVQVTILGLWLFLDSTPNDAKIQAPYTIHYYGDQLIRVEEEDGKLFHNGVWTVNPEGKRVWVPSSSFKFIVEE